MDSRKVFAVLIFLLLIGAGAYAATAIFKPKTSPIVPPISDEPNPNNQFEDQQTPDVGKKAYSKFGNATMYTLNFNSFKTPAKDELIGTITGSKYLATSEESFYVIDSQYLVSQALVRVE